jgi:hypothetical protein
VIHGSQIDFPYFKMFSQEKNVRLRKKTFMLDNIKERKDCNPENIESGMAFF